MMAMLRRFLLVFGVFLLLGSSAGATVSVAPVVIEAVEAQAGQVFSIVCQNWGEEDVSVDLSLALFDQDEFGRVVLLESTEAVAKAAQFLTIPRDVLSLGAKEQEIIQVELVEDTFDNLYAVLFIKPRQGGIQARMAVLLLLSTAAGDTQTELAISSWRKEDEGLHLTIENHGPRHGPWEGELHFFDASNQLSEKRQIRSGLVLVGRSRGLDVALPSWVHRVEILSAHSGQVP